MKICLKMKLLNHFNLILISFHRLEWLIKSTNEFEELPQHTLVECHRAWKTPTVVKRIYVALLRGGFQWDRSRPVSGLVFSEHDTIVEYVDVSEQKIVRASIICLIVRVFANGQLPADILNDKSYFQSLPPSFCKLKKKKKREKERNVKKR